MSALLSVYCQHTPGQRSSGTARVGTTHHVSALEFVISMQWELVPFHLPLADQAFPAVCLEVVAEVTALDALFTLGTGHHCVPTGVHVLP